MSGYVQLGDVHAYYEEDGHGEPLVLLHPGLADSRAFEEHLPALAERFRVFRPDRRGHGRTPDVDGPITYDVMAQETIAFLERVVGGPAYLLGHSDGAPVALLVALERPDLVRRLVFSAGVFHYDGWTPGAIELDDETVAFFVDYWGAVAPQGPEHFDVVKAKLDRMHREEPTLTEDDLAAYPGPALVMVGDRDEEIRPSHTLALFKGLPDSQLAVLPGTGHGGIDTRIVIDFLTAPREGTPHRSAEGAPPMIARIWSGAVRTTDADSYASYIRQTGFAEYGRTPGNRGAWLLRRDDNGTTEYITLSLWATVDAIRAFAGEDIEAAVLYPEDERYLINGESRTTHYDVVDHIPDRAD